MSGGAGPACGHRLKAAGRSLARSLATAASQSADYRRLLVQAVHQCAIRFQEVAAAVVHTLMDFLGDSHYESAVDVITFVRYAGAAPAARAQPAREACELTRDAVLAGRAAARGRALSSEVVEKFPDLRAEILAKLLATFGDLKLAKILRGALWVLGEFSTDQQGAWRWVCKRLMVARGSAAPDTAHHQPLVLPLPAPPRRH